MDPVDTPLGGLSHLDRHRGTCMRKQCAVGGSLEEQTGSTCNTKSPRCIRSIHPHTFYKTVDVCFGVVGTKTSIRHFAGAFAGVPEPIKIKFLCTLADFDLWTPCGNHTFRSTTPNVLHQSLPSGTGVIASTHKRPFGRRRSHFGAWLCCFVAPQNGPNGTGWMGVGTNSATYRRGFPT
jgi:hypothetical protein